MDKIVIVYGSSFGNTRFVAERASQILPDALLLPIKEFTPEILKSYTFVIIGTSTWGVGQFQDDYENFVARIHEFDFTEKTVALFGVGDQYNYPDTYCDGMGKLYEVLKSAGAKLVGKWSSDDYNFSQSKALNDDGFFVGLALDEDNEPDLTPYRLKKWLKSIGIQLTE